MSTPSRFSMQNQTKPPPQGRVVGISVALSVLFHAAVIAVLVVTPSPSGGHRLAPGTVSVRLVSLPGPSAGSGQPADATARPLPQPITERPEAIKKLPTVPLPPQPQPQPQPQPVQKPSPPEVQEAPKVVSLAPPEKPIRPKASLKKKTKDPAKIIKGAIDRIKKGVNQPKSQQPSVSAAIERLKKRVAEGEARQHEPYRPPPSGATPTGAASGGGGGGGAITLEHIYRSEIATQVEKNWAFSKQLAGDATGLEAKLEFKVLANGEITDIRFHTKSNNAYLDDSAYKAIVKSNPVAPHPRGISKSYVMVGLRFSPEGVR